jgi:FkbM family methyltransferase
MIALGGPAVFGPEMEDELKEAFFAHSRSGYFVEVGANDPQDLSQTWHLEQRGWTGILVEPQPELAAELRRRRAARVFAVACSSPEHAGTDMVLHLAGIHSSLDPALNISTVSAHGSIKVPVRALDDILSEAGAPIPLDLLSIDVEGLEIDVLRGLALERWRPRLILVEDLAMNLRLHRYLRRHGYKWVRRTGLNSWYVPAADPTHVGPRGRWQFFRKHYLGLPFRHVREASRRWRHGTRRRGAAPKPSPAAVDRRPACS